MALGPSPLSPTSLHSVPTLTQDPCCVPSRWDTPGQEKPRLYLQVRVGTPDLHTELLGLVIVTISDPVGQRAQTSRIYLCSLTEPSQQRCWACPWANRGNQGTGWVRSG